MVMIIIQFEPHFEVRTAPLIQCVKGGGGGEEVEQMVDQSGTHVGGLP